MCALCMADIKNGTVTITGLDALDKKLAQLKTDSPGFEKRLRGAIRKILGEARANLRKDAADPSGADHAHGFSVQIEPDQTAERKIEERSTPCLQGYPICRI